jgi:hypothetical protein
MTQRSAALTGFHKVFLKKVRSVIPSARLSMVSDDCEPAGNVFRMDAPSDAPAQCRAKAVMGVLPSERL